MRLFFLWLKWCLLLSWFPQLSSAQHRRYIQQQCPHYRYRKRVVLKVWLISATTMLFNPALYIVLPVALFTTFLSFSILDE